MSNKKIYSVGETFRATIPFSRPKSRKVYIMHVLPSCYEDQKLIVYKVYGKHKQRWHEFMCYDWQMDGYIEVYERIKEHGRE